MIEKRSCALTDRERERQARITVRHKDGRGPAADDFVWKDALVGEFAGAR